MQIEGAQYAHLCTNMSNMHHRRSGYPFGMLVDFAADGAGFPIFCLSPLSIHSHNVRDDPRCSLVVQMPGWLGLSNARVTMFGDVFELPESMQVCWQSSLCSCSLCLQSLQSSLFAVLAELPVLLFAVLAELPVLLFAVPAELPVLLFAVLAELPVLLFAVPAELPVLLFAVLAELAELTVLGAALPRAAARWCMDTVQWKCTCVSWKPVLCSVFDPACSVAHDDAARFLQDRQGMRKPLLTWLWCRGHL